MQKTYNPEVDGLIKKLISPWDVGPSVVYAMVVDEDAVQLVAEMIYKMYEAEHYNQQIGD